MDRRANIYSVVTPTGKSRGIAPMRDILIWGATLLAGAMIAATSLALLDHHIAANDAAIGDTPDAAGPAQTGGIGARSLAQRPATTMTTIACEKLPNVPGKSITIAIVTFPPAGYSPRHHHPGSVAAFVLKGTLRSQLEGGPVVTYSAGQTWFEPPGTIHVFAENASSIETAELLATFIADNDCGPLVIPD